MGDSNAFKLMAVGAAAIVGLAAITLTGIAVVTQFRNTNLVDNATATAFIAGIALFGTFSTIIVMALIGKIVVNMFKSGKSGGF